MALNNIKIHRGNNGVLMNNLVPTIESSFTQQKVDLTKSKVVKKQENMLHSRASIAKFVKNKIFETFVEENIELNKESIIGIIDQETSELDVIRTTVSTLSDDYKDALDISVKNEVSKEEVRDISDETNVENTTFFENKSKKIDQKKTCLSGSSFTRNVSAKSYRNQKFHKSASALNPQRKSINNLSVTNSLPGCKRTLEMQFLTKKKRYDVLLKESSDKQTAVLDYFHSLNDLKKKLEKFGKSINLEVPRLIDYERMNVNPKSSESKNSFNPNIIKELKTLFRQCDQFDKKIDDECKMMTVKYNQIIKTMNLYKKDGLYPNQLQKQLDEFKANENKMFQNLLLEISERNKMLHAMYEKINNINSYANQTEQIHCLESKVRKQERDLNEINLELEKSKHLLNKNEQEMINEEIASLKEKNSVLQETIEAERKQFHVELEKYKHFKNNVKQFKSSVKAFESGKEETANKFKALSLELRTTQLRLKHFERAHSHEINEINKVRQLDRLLIEKLNKERSTFESRIQLALETIQKLKTKKDEMECSLMKQLTSAKDDLDISHNQIMELKTELANMHKQLYELEMQYEKAADLLGKREILKINLDSDKERECDLQLELIAQRATIRALHEKIEANASEKLRFIQAIDKITGNSEEIRESIIKGFVKSGTELNLLENSMKRKEETISKMKMEIQILKADKQMLLAKLESVQIHDGNDSLHQRLSGEIKEEESILKTIENEHKIAKYENEIVRKDQTIMNLESILKVRDGLLGMVKAKKDDLNMENQSLTKYSEQMRNCVLESKNELKLKCQEITSLRSHFHTKSKHLRKAEHRIGELEANLSATNEKRYKLQDTVSNMEKELQMIKSQLYHQTANGTYGKAVVADAMAFFRKSWNDNGMKPFNEVPYYHDQVLKMFGGQKCELFHKIDNAGEERQEAVKDDSGLQLIETGLKCESNLNDNPIILEK